MSAKDMQNTDVQTTTHYWGYREIDPSEFKFVGGGDDGGGDCGDCGDSGGDCGDSGCDAGGGSSDAGSSGVSDTGGAGTGGRGCSAADTENSCNARSEGYQACDQLGYGAQAAASVFGNSALQDLAAQVGPTCRAAVDNVVDAAYRTEMWEQRNQSSYMQYDFNIQW